MRDDDLEGILRAERDAEGAPDVAQGRVWSRVQGTLGIAAGAGAAGTAASGQASATGAGISAGLGVKTALALVSIVAAGAIGLVSTRHVREPARARVETGRTERPPRTAPAPIVVTPPAATAAPESPAPAPPRAASPRPDRDVDLEAERAALASARTAIATSDGAGAVTALADHVRRWPRGRLSEERDGLYVRALVLAGRPDEARARADRFRASHPGSLYQGVVDAAIRSIL